MIEMITNNLLQIFTFFGIIILFFTTKNLLPNYFNEKGKNLATKEDISEITNLVEKVKHNFTSETEKLKANLSILTNIQVGLVAEERNAIMAFLRAFTNYYSICNDSTMGGIDDYNSSELSQYRINIDSSYNQVRITKAILEVFLEDTGYANKNCTLS